LRRRAFGDLLSEDGSDEWFSDFNSVGIGQIAPALPVRTVADAQDW